MKYCVIYEDVALYDNLSKPTEYFDDVKSARKLFNEYARKIKKYKPKDWVLETTDDSVTIYPPRQYFHNHISVRLEIK
jgi:hypothetical protein